MKVLEMVLNTLTLANPNYPAMIDINSIVSDALAASNLNMALWLHSNLPRLTGKSNWNYTTLLSGASLSGSLNIFNLIYSMTPYNVKPDFNAILHDGIRTMNPDLFSRILKLAPADQKWDWTSILDSALFYLTESDIPWFEQLLQKYPVDADYQRAILRACWIESRELFDYLLSKIPKDKVKTRKLIDISIETGHVPWMTWVENRLRS